METDPVHHTETELTQRQLTEAEEQRNAEALEQVYALLIRRGQERRAREIDLSAYAYPWEYNERTRTWLCDVPPNRGSIVLVQTGILRRWQGCIEQPDHFKNLSIFFYKLEEALSWTEQQLTELHNKVEDSASPKLIEYECLTLADFTLEKRPDLAPYWITAQDIEPKRITYQLLIDLDYTPDDYETMEMSFGKLFRYNEKFATPAKLAKALQIDTNHVLIKQPIGTNDAWYRIVSLTRYYTEPLAMTQAQTLWDQSRIVAQYAAGKVLRACYGYQEVETGYETLLGGCEPEDHPYPTPINRPEYMAEQALRLTLIHALDVEGFRAYSGIPAKYVSDEALLFSLHEKRAESVYLPDTAKIDSQRWLASHQPAPDR